MCGTVSRLLWVWKIGGVRGAGVIFILLALSYLGESEGMGSQLTRLHTLVLVCKHGLTTTVSALEHGIVRS